MEMVRAPARKSGRTRGIMDHRRDTPAGLANSLRDKKPDPNRRVQIRHEPRHEAVYAARDIRSGLVILRHHDRARLQAMCRRLGWQVLDGETPGPEE